MEGNAVNAVNAVMPHYLDLPRIPRTAEEDKMPSLTEIALAICAEEQQRPLGSMTLDEFAHSGRVARIDSAALGCVVLFAADNADEAAIANAGCVVYRVRELRHLLDVTPDHLRLIHETKARFDGEVVG